MEILQIGERPKAYQWDISATARQHWNAKAPAKAGNNEITIYDVIGSDGFGGGFTAKRMDAALRSIGAKSDVTVKINSPGGDVFEGVAIFNALKMHEGAVDVEVMGIAASAASFIAMAGDSVRMQRGSMLMIHNSWGLVIGNRHDLFRTGEVLGKIDDAMAGIYADRTGAPRIEIAKMMDNETFLQAEEAVKMGFVDEAIEAEKAEDGEDLPKGLAARRKLDALLAEQGVPRSERRRLMREASGGTQDAAPTVTQDADLNVSAMRELINSLTER